MIHEFVSEFRIVVVMMDYFVPPGLLERLKSLEEKGIIEKYFLISIPRSSLKFFLGMRKTLEGLEVYKFDVWLTHSEMQLEERYISECLLPKGCLRVVFSHNATFLLKNELLARKLMGESETAQGLVQPKTGVRLIEKIRKSKSVMAALQKAPPFLLRPFKRARKKFRQRVYRHIILPKLFLGMSFRFGRWDDLTEIGSGRSDAVIFCDDVEAAAHRPLFKNSNVYVARYPTSGNCCCQNGQKKNEAILSPLSGFVGSDQISEKYLSLYYRDFKTVLSQTGAKNIHLRVHPDEIGRWSYQLRDYLIGRGIKVEMVTSEKPLRDVVCQYVGVAGCGSSSFRDCRAVCDDVFVIGFVAISKHWGANPKFAFGKSEGIGWIEEDGSYDQKIFDKKKFISPSRKSVVEIVKEELERKVANG